METHCKHERQAQIILKQGALLAVLCLLLGLLCGVAWQAAVTGRLTRTSPQIQTMPEGFQTNKEPMPSPEELDQAEEIEAYEEMHRL